MHSLAADAEAQAELQTTVDAIQDTAVCHLLTDCLRQTTAVLHLSRDEAERSDVETLQTLIRLAGAESLTSEPAKEAERCLHDITRAIVMESNPPIPARRTLRRIPLSHSD